MQTGVYAIESAVEASHWWFVGRRRLFARELARFDLSRDARVLDIGTGTGSNLRLLRDLGFRNVVGVDANDEAIRFCASKGFHVEKGDAASLPFDNDSVDLVLATDIIEHVGQDDLALAEICRVLRPGGHALVTVPAFRSLWGLQDEVAEHKRRYRKRGLLGEFKRASLVPLRSYYFNYLLFIPIWIARAIIRIFRVRLVSENQVNSPALNRVLRAIFMLDVLTAGWVSPPFGVSILAIVARAPLARGHKQILSAGS